LKLQATASQIQSVALPLSLSISPMGATLIAVFGHISPGVLGLILILHSHSGTYSDRDHGVYVSIYTVYYLADTNANEPNLSRS